MGPPIGSTIGSPVGPAAGLADRHRAPAPGTDGIHYGWWIVLAATFSMFVCLGIGRFALGMLLPAMGEALSLNYVQMGWISTANFIGYFLGALWVGRLLPKYGERRLIAMALMLTVVSMLGVALSKGFAPILSLFGVTGLGSGIALVCTVSLLPHWFVSHWRGRAVGFLSVGFGLAVILAGWSVPWIANEMGPIGWRLGWGGLAAVCLPLVLFCLIVVRNRPAELGLEPFGDENGGAAATTNTNAAAIPRADVQQGLAKVITRLSVIYFLFGATYVVYGTFIVTTLVREHGMDETRAGQFWILMGVFSLCCGPLMGSLSDRMGRRAGISVSLLFQACAYGLISYANSDMAIYASIALYGLSAFGVPLIMSATVADYATPVRAAAIIGTITAIFGVGQILGPILAGLMADYSGSFTPAYLAAAALVALAIAITLTLPDPPS